MSRRAFVRTVLVVTACALTGWGGFMFSLRQSVDRKMDVIASMLAHRQAQCDPDGHRCHVVYVYSAADLWALVGVGP